MTSRLKLIVPDRLNKYLRPSIAKFKNVKWFQIANDYFNNPPKIIYNSIETQQQPDLLNILSELKKFVNSITYSQLTFEFSQPSISRTHNLTNQLQYTINNTKTPQQQQHKIIKQFNHIKQVLNNINPAKLTKDSRRKIRKYIEISPLGKKLLNLFYNDLKSRELITPDMELILNPYTSLINLAEIYAQCNEYTQIIYSVPELGIHRSKLNLYYPDCKRELYIPSVTSNNNNEITNWIDDTISRICFFNRLLNTTLQPRNIHLFLAEFRKEFMHVSGKEDLIFTSSEINTGVCDMRDIIITRSEECHKTLLHELIHFHSLDFKHELYDDLCAKLFNITTEQQSFNLFEAHTECLASILHCVSRYPNNFKEFQDTITKQIYYTITKAAQILKISNCQTFLDFTNISSINPINNINNIPQKKQLNNNSKKCQLTENTNVFSYYFIKLFIYFNLGIWLDKCCNNNTARFIDTHKEGKAGLLEIIQKAVKQKIIIDLLNDCISDINEIATKKTNRKKKTIRKKNKKYNNSLRMVWID